MYKTRAIQTENLATLSKCTNNSFMSKLLDVHSIAKKLGLGSEQDINRQKQMKSLQRG